MPGMFQGEMTPTTPRGQRVAIDTLPWAEGRTSPIDW
jgi:hypothetical protein